MIVNRNPKQSVKGSVGWRSPFGSRGKEGKKKCGNKSPNRSAAAIRRSDWRKKAREAMDRKWAEGLQEEDIMYSFLRLRELGSQK
jgi:hypothetical protein